MSKQGEATLLIKIKEAGSQILDHLVITVHDVIEAVMELPKFFMEAFEAYAENEKAINSLNQAMVNQGIYTTELSDKYHEMAESIQKVTTFSHDQVTQAQAILQGFIGQREVTEELVMATANLATKTGSLESAAQMMGKSIGSSTNALRRQGVEINENSTRSEKMAQAIEGVNKLLGGQAEAQAKGVGVMQQAKNIWQDIMETIGSGVAPAFEALAHFFIDLIGPMNENIGIVTSLKLTFGILADTVVGLTTTIKILADTTMAVVGGVGTAIVDLVHGNIKQAGADLVDMFHKAGSDISETWAANTKAMESITDSMFNSDKQKMDDKAALEAAAAAKRLEAAQEEANQEKMIKIQKEIDLSAVKEQMAEANMALGFDRQAKILQAQLAADDVMIKQAQTTSDKVAALQKKKADLDKLNVEKQKELEIKLNQERLKGYSTFFDGIAALSESKNKTIAGIAKGAAITKATIDAYLAIQNALANVPFPANIAASVGIGVMAFANVAKIGGIQLAEGGIVKARPGGIQATIGEGGRDEAVIPLENGQIPGSGQAVIYFTGPVLGTESQAMEFARVIDKSLLKLRQTNQSVAFEDLA